MNRSLGYIVVSVGVLCLATATFSVASGDLRDIQQDAFDVRLGNGSNASAVISKQGVKITFTDKTVNVMRIGESVIVQTHDSNGLSTFIPDIRSLDYNLSGDQALNVEDHLVELDNLVEFVQPTGRNSGSGGLKSDNFPIALERIGVIRTQGSCTSQSITYVAASMAMAAACATPGVNVALCAIAVLGFIAAQDTWISCMQNVAYAQK